MRNLHETEPVALTLRNMNSLPRNPPSLYTSLSLPSPQTVSTPVQLLPSPFPRIEGEYGPLNYWDAFRPGSGITLVCFDEIWVTVGPRGKRELSDHFSKLIDNIHQ